MKVFSASFSSNWWCFEILNFLLSGLIAKMHHTTKNRATVHFYDTEISSQKYDLVFDQMFCFNLELSLVQLIMSQVYSVLLNIFQVEWV